MPNSREEELARLEDCTCTREAASGKALLVEIQGGRSEWIPTSQIHADSEVYKVGDTGTLVIPEWLATKKGLT